MKVETSIKPQKVSVSVNSPNVGIKIGSPVAREYIEREPYTGRYVITPTTEDIVLQTNGKRMIENVTVKSIPQNYGLITWNGSFLTVS